MVLFIDLVLVKPQVRSWQLFVFPKVCFFLLVLEWSTYDFFLFGGKQLGMSCLREDGSKREIFSYQSVGVREQKRRVCSEGDLDNWKLTACHVELST